jgi:putative MFS transporter
VAVAYVTELTKSSRRGQLIAAYQFTAPLGFLAAAYCSSWVIPHLGWQAMFYIGAIPAFLTLIVRVFVPESPRWLARHGRIEQADKVLTDIERRMLKKSGSLPPLVVAPIPAISESTAAGRFSELFSSHYMRRTLTLWIIWICASTIGYGLLAWLPTIYRTVYKMPLEEIFRFATMSGVGSLVGGVAGILLVDLIGRRLIFIVSFSLATLAMVALWYFNQSQAITPTLVVTFATLGVGATAIGQVVLWGYTSESYPTRIRAFATGTASVWGRAATLIMPIAVGFLLANSGVNAIYLVFAFMGFIGLVIVILFALETRGRRLEELSP